MSSIIPSPVIMMEADLLHEERQDDSRPNRAAIMQGAERLYADCA